MSSSPRARAPALALAVIAAVVVAVAALASEVPLKFDDLDYLPDAIRYPDDPLYWRRDGWYLHWRPAAYLAWWALGPLALDGTGVRVAEVATWLGVAGLFGHLGWRSAGWPGLGVALLAVPFNPYALETLDWKSWITSTGGALGLAAGLVELSRGARARPLAIAAAGLVALGFKEIALFTLGVAAVAVGPSRRVRAVGAVAVVLALLAAAPAGHRLQGASLEVAWFYLFRLHGLAWILPFAVARVRPERAWVGVVAGAVAIALPNLGGALVLGALLSLARDAPAWFVATAAAWAVAVGGSQHTPAYLLEGWLVVAARLVTSPPPISPRTWPFVGLLAAAALVPWATDRPRAIHEAAEQRRFFATFDPPPAEVLYVGRDKALDLDALVWLSRGASLRRQPPPGTRPVQVGPRSCVWADVLPLASGETAESWPTPGRCKGSMGRLSPATPGAPPGPQPVADRRRMAR